MTFLAIIIAFPLFACSPEEPYTRETESAGSGGSRFIPIYPSAGGSSSLGRSGSGGYPQISGAGGSSGSGGIITITMDGSIAGTSADPDGGDSDATVPSYQICEESDVGEDDDAGNDGEPCLKMGGLKVQYIMVSEGDSTEHYRITFNISNIDSLDIPLQALALRYYYTVDQGSQDQQFECWFAEIGNTNVHGSFYEHTGADADSYLELSFEVDDSLSAGDETGQIQAGFHKSDWSRYDFTNDYSYQQTTGGFEDAPLVTLYYDGNLVWGVVPN